MSFSIHAPPATAVRPDATHAASSPSEEREREQFMQDLSQFMHEIGKPLCKIPIMGYKELDLFQLFKEVVARGGFSEVVRRVGTWSKIWKRLSNFDPSITDSSFRLRKNYERYLLEYEHSNYPQNRAKSPTAPFTSDSSKKGRSKQVQLPRLPLVLESGDLVIQSFGEYKNSRADFPIGFCSQRRFTSLSDPSVQGYYYCRIELNDDNQPQFVVETCPTADSNYNLLPLTYDSPSAAWEPIINTLSSMSTQSPVQGPPGSPQRNFDAMDLDVPQNDNGDKPSAQPNITPSTPPRSTLESVKSGRMTGIDLFGLTHPLVFDVLNEMAAAMRMPSSLSRSSSVNSNMDELGSLKRKSQSEMSLAALMGSEDEEEQIFNTTHVQRKRVAVSKHDRPLSTVEEVSLVENAVSLLTQWQQMRTSFVC